MNPCLPVLPVCAILQDKQQKKHLSSGTLFPKKYWLFCIACFHLFLFAGAQPKTPADSIINAKLFHAIRMGDISQMDALLKTGASANAQLNGYSALMAAALNGTTDEMKRLIEKGADVNYFNKDSISAIWLAVPDLEKTELLISKGANAAWRSREGNTVLMKLAAIPGTARLMQVLINAGCVAAESGRGNDIMYNAASSGDTAIIGLLIRNNVSVNDTSSFGDYPINSATNFRCFDALQMLVEHGARVNVSPAHAQLPLFIGITPLMWAAVSNDKPSFYYLLKHGADAKATSPGGYNTLMFLAMADEDDPEMTKALIEHGADPLAKALDETDVLHHFRLRGNSPSVEILSRYANKK